MRQTTSGWTTRHNGIITPLPQTGHPDAVRLDSRAMVGFDRFDSARFVNHTFGSVRLAFSGTGSFSVYVKVKTTAGTKKFQLTPNRKPLQRVSATRYRMGMGRDARNGEWGTYTFDIAALIAQVDPGVQLTKLIRVYVRVRDELIIDPPVAVDSGGSVPPVVATPTPTPEPTPTPDPTPTPQPTPEPTATAEPTPPPAVDPGGPATRAEAARFLIQASFGPSEASVDELMALGSYGAWIDRQWSLPMSTTLAYTQANSNGSNRTARHQAWWSNAINEPDQLRQRVAFALSELFVVSDNDYELGNSQYGICHYYDMLARHVTGNFRDLMADVTLHPVMGIYLSMLRNQRADPARNIRPDENYARELLQLFSIGLVELQTNGMPVLSGGRPVPTFDQTTIESFARVFTGWNYNGVESFTSNNQRDNHMIDPMTAVESYHDTGAKTLLNGTVVPANRTAQQDLDAALDNIFAHRNVGPFISRRLIQRLVTSNPTPAYIGRCAAVFNNNGSGVRGDIAATVRAILLDPEARTAIGSAPATFGKPREPIVRYLNLWRAFDVAVGPDADGTYATSEAWLSAVARFMGQGPIQSPSVFNFFRPDYSPSGSTLDVPEMQIMTEANLAATNNAVNSTVYTFNNRGDGYGQISRINIEREVAMASDPGRLLDHLDVLMLGGAMTPTMRTALSNHLASIPLAGEGAEIRATDAIFAIAASPTCCIQK